MLDLRRFKSGNTQHTLNDVWRTPSGVRALSGSEAALFRELLGWVYDQTDDAARYEDSDIAFESGIPAYDRLEPNQQLALLAEVGSALLDEQRTCMSDHPSARINDPRRVIYPIQQRESGNSPSCQKWL